MWKNNINGQLPLFLSILLIQVLILLNFLRYIFTDSPGETTIESITLNALIFLLGDFQLLIGTLIAGVFIAFFINQIASWYYKTNHDRKIQISTSLVASLYGLTIVLYILLIEITGGYELSWRFYGLGGLVTTPLLFGYMVGNLGVSPSTGETVS